MKEHCFSVTLPKGGLVSCVIDVPDIFTPRATPVVVMGHGAGLDMRSDFMELWATLLCERGLCVVRFNFPFKESGKKRPPDRMPTLVETYHRVVAASAERTGSPPGPLFLGGKSMGGRVATLLGSTGRVKPSGYILLGYPLHPSGKKQELRTEHFAKLRQPLLFVQGDRDSLCDLDLLRAARRADKLKGAIHVVPGGDHSLKLPASQRSRQDAEDDRAADFVLRFVERVLNPTG